MIGLQNHSKKQKVLPNDQTYALSPSPFKGNSKKRKGSIKGEGAGG